MAFKLGNIKFTQPQVKATGFEGVRSHYPAKPDPTLKTNEGLQARLEALDKRERPPVVSNRVICTA